MHPDLKGKTPGARAASVDRAESPLDLDRAADRVDGARELDEEGIPDRPRLFAVELLELGPKKLPEVPRDPTGASGDPGCRRRKTREVRVEDGGRTDDSGHDFESGRLH